jgi:hypothetical protein
LAYFLFYPNYDDPSCIRQLADSIPNSLHVFEQNLLASAIIELGGSAVGVASDSLSGFKGTVALEKISEYLSPEMSEANAITCQSFR